MPDTLTIGLDGGGTGCRARLYNSAGAALAEASGGPVNLLIGDGAASFDEILRVARAALRAAGLPEGAEARCRLGLGVAGATPTGRARFFARTPPFAETRIVSDSHAAALGAFGGGDGGIVILGTGAVACVLRGGAARDIGGWGFTLDDFGSGADIGRRALRAALRDCDSGARGALAAAVLDQFGDDPWRAVDWAAAARPGDFGTFAPIAFDLAEAGDPDARAIIDRAATEAERLIDLARRHGARRIALLGSVAQRLRPRLTADLTEPAGDAADGAAYAIREGLGAAA
jgi:glucosamine kinase